MRPRIIRSYWDVWPELFRSMLSRDGLLQLFAVALFLYFLELIPLGVTAGLAMGIYVTYFFRVLTHAARGNTTLPEPADFEGWSSVTLPTFRFFLATACIWLPAAVYAYGVLGSEVLKTGDLTSILDPVLFLLAFLGVGYFPAATISAAISESWLGVINPWITVRMIFRIPRQYILTVVLWLLLSVAAMGLRGVLAGVRAAIPIPFVLPLLIQMLNLVIPVFVAFIFGRLIYQNGAHFGVWLAGEEEEPEWPDAVPQAPLPTDTRTNEVRPHRSSLEVEGWQSEPAVETLTPNRGFGAVLDAGTPAGLWASVQVGPNAELRPQGGVSGLGFISKREGGSSHPPSGLELDLPPPSEPPQDEPEPSPPSADEAEVNPEAEARSRKLMAALEGSDARQVLTLFSGFPWGQHVILGPRLELRLAGILERAEQFEDAVRACQRALQTEPTGPFAPRSLFTGGRILYERLGDSARAKTMLAYLVKHHPKDELAVRATDLLRRL